MLIHFTDMDYVSANPRALFDQEVGSLRPNRLPFPLEHCNIEDVRNYLTTELFQDYLRIGGKKKRGQEESGRGEDIEREGDGNGKPPSPRHPPLRALPAARRTRQVVAPSPGCRVEIWPWDLSHSTDPSASTGFAGKSSSTGCWNWSWKFSL